MRTREGEGAEIECASRRGVIALRIGVSACHRGRIGDMDIRPLEELRESDERTLIFGPLGIGGQMRAEDSAEFLQRLMARDELVPAVADGTRRSFDHLREIFPYGLFSYGIFTLVAEHALLVFEQALRDRFIEFHQGTVTFTDPQTGQEQTVPAASYEKVAEFTRRHRRWRLRIGIGPEMIPFNGMLNGLRAWARHTGLLRGQRNRAVEDAITRLRNHVAHPSSYHLTTPADAANTISDLAEIINHLWGSPTPGGRLYPAPIRRTTLLLSWNTESGEITSWPITSGGPAARRQRAGRVDGDEFAAAPGGTEQGWEHILIRSVPDDWDLMNFDARYQAGRYPAEWLWGPGSGEEASAWLDAEQPQDDEADILDRLFLLRYHDKLLYLPRNANQAASVADEEKPGTWYIIKADFPEHAFNHQRQLLSGGFGCIAIGSCSRCPVETVGKGSWQQVMTMLTDLGVSPRTIEVPDVRVPPVLSHWPRCNRIIGNGSWDLP
jgi:hypothetical protein